MNIAKKIGTLSALAAAMLAVHPAQAEDTFINPDWANKAWYIGAGLGQSRASIDDKRLIGSLGAHGATVTSFTTDERELGGKLFVGKQLNQYLALEAGIFDLGKFGFNSTTSGGGVLNGEAGFRGVNLDLVGQLPLSQRFSLLGRAGMSYARTSDHFTGNRLYAVSNPNPRENKFNPKVGLGLEYKFSEALAVRGEVERYRLNDAVGNRGNADLVSLSLVYKLGRPAARPVVYTPPPAAQPVPEAAAPVVVPPPAKPVPQPSAEKVTFASETLFAFDKSVLTPAGQSALDAMLGNMKGMETEVIVTVGHTDSVGTDEYNQKLSLRRAEAVKAYLVAQGVDSKRVYTEGKGESQAVADNKTSDGRAKNRRVSVEVVGVRRDGK
ncbi:OmpA family protein [Oxalobacteraceae bacterium]|nr:OmpA family protein [Oxalobacteraceae bacterium]